MDGTDMADWPVVGQGKVTGNDATSMVGFRTDDAVALGSGARSRTTTKPAAARMMTRASTATTRLRPLDFLGAA
jgi:hypothetical protein